MIFRTVFIRLLALYASRAPRPPRIDPVSLIVPLNADARIPLDPDVPALEGAVNFRDLGGYRTLDGRVVRRGLVYRSGELAALGERDLGLLTDRFGLKLVCDLRSAEEVASAPNRLPDGVQTLALALSTGSRTSDRALLRALVTGHAERIETAFGQTYLRFVDFAAPAFGHLFKRLADPASLPTVIHCTAGKDRTGIASAILLALLGVPDETIVADYSQSNAAFDRVYEAARRDRSLSSIGLSPDVLLPVLVANPVWIRAVLQHIRVTYGSVENYVRERAGVDDATIARLREMLLEAAPG
jgi:protein-tyrosine phosphatase